MLRKFPLLVVLLSAALIGVVGCSDDAVTPVNDDSGTITGEIDPGSAGFEYVIQSTPGPDPLQGPFVLRGSNIRYDDTIGALLVDLTIENGGIVAHPEPVGLLFARLLPDGVTILNPDHPSGPVATITFEFANDDGMWTPGEKSLPRMVQFGVASGVSIGFVGHVLIQPNPLKGTISGVVWHDRNEDGVRDDDEPGVPGVEILMTRGDEELNTNLPPERLWRTITGADGRYRFHGLDAGFYTVGKTPSPKYQPTTPNVMQVLLVMEDGDVSSFPHADFGCIPIHDGPPPMVGDFVEAYGVFDASVEGIRAREVDVVYCFRHCGPGWLVGPVTDIVADKHILEVMGTPVSFAPNDSTANGGAPDFDSIEVGDRVRVQIADEPVNGVWIGLDFSDEARDVDVVTGYVRAMVVSADGKAIGVRVFDTNVLFPNTTNNRPPQ